MSAHERLEHDAERLAALNTELYEQRQHHPLDDEQTDYWRRVQRACDQQDCWAEHLIAILQG